MAETDPISQVYNRLWDLAKSSQPLLALVRLGNMIELNQQSSSSPLKEEVSDSDLPEIVLIATQVEGKLTNTSSSSMLKVRYEWLISTGDPSIVRGLMPIMWALFAAMAQWPQEMTGDPLVWKEEYFLKRLDMLDANNGLTDPEKNRGIEGWSSVWACEAEMHFKTSNLVTYSTELVS